MIVREKAQWLDLSSAKSDIYKYSYAHTTSSTPVVSDDAIVGIQWWSLVIYVCLGFDKGNIAMLSQLVAYILCVCICDWHPFIKFCTFWASVSLFNHSKQSLHVDLFQERG